MSQFGVKASRKYVLHRMRRLQIKSRIRRKKYLYKPCQKAEIYENILAKHFTAKEKNTVWETDVTEFHLPDGSKLYLSAIMDRYGHSIVSYNMSRHNDQALTLDDLMREYGLTHSMSRVGKCIDNGPMEGFWGTLKSECYYGKKIKTFDEMKTVINTYMVFYNMKRRQESLSLKTPYEYRLSGPAILPSLF
jgi:putative transposase